MSEEVGLDYIDLGLNDVDAADGGFTTLPPGDYVFEVEKIIGGQSKSGNPKMTAQLKVIEALDDSEEHQKCVGEPAFHTFALVTDKEFPRRRLKAFVQACGVEIDAKGGFNAPDLVEAQFAASVKHEDYEVTNPITGEVDTRLSMRIFRERHLDDLDAERETASKSNGKAAEPEPPAEPEEKKPTRQRRSRRRAAPSR